MRTTTRGLLPLGMAMLLSLALGACGGGGGGGGSGASSTGQAAGPATTGNTAIAPSVSANQVVVAAQASGFHAVNRPYVSVTLCAPGTSTCQTVNDVIVDTGSSGLRIYASALSSTLLSALPVQLQGGQPVNECAMFAGGNTWGSVREADIRMAGEVAPAAPMQVVADGISPVPAGCSGSGTMLTSTSDIAGNGLIGIDTLTKDCGSYCAQNSANGYYYAGNSGVAVATASQVGNPVALFGADNNGVVLRMPAIGAGGAASASGTLTFGIDTQSDNMLSQLGLGFYTTSANQLMANFNGASALPTILDTGSAAYYFDDPAIAQCSAGPAPSTMFCPGGTLALSAQVAGYNGTQSTLSFDVANADALLGQSPTMYEFNDLGQSSASYAALGGMLDLGLPFFFGRDVAIVFDGAQTLEGSGPAIAF